MLAKSIRVHVQFHACEKWHYIYRISCTSLSAQLYWSQTMTRLGFEYCSVPCSCMHLTLVWMPLHLLPACCIVLTQYQMHMAHLHFSTLKHLIMYLQPNPDAPLAFNLTRFHISAIKLEISYAPPIDTLNYSPDGYDIGCKC
jgi:hypothetical protein